MFSQTHQNLDVLDAPSDFVGLEPKPSKTLLDIHPGYALPWPKLYKKCTRNAYPGCISRRVLAPNRQNLMENEDDHRKNEK